jgi:hypothetical protein
MADDWKPSADGYTLNRPKLGGRIMLHGAPPGLRDLQVTRTDRWPGPVLAIDSVCAAGSPGWPAGFHSPQPPHRVRRELVDVQIEPTPRCPVRLDLYWSAASPNRIDGEVLASSTTPLDRLEVRTISRAPTCGRVGADELLMCLGGSRREWLNVAASHLPRGKWCVAPRDVDAARFGLDGRSPSFDESALCVQSAWPIVLYRPAGRSWSYVEMSRRDDCARVVARVYGGHAEWSFGLFGLDLEKGVILRGRVCGAIIPRRGDTQLAVKLFRRVAAEAPHLSV